MCRLKNVHVSGAWTERKMERCGQKMGWAGAERWADIPENAWAERGGGGRGGESGCHKNRLEGWAANRPLRSDALSARIPRHLFPPHGTHPHSRL